jgi:hypothetical protein
MRKWAVILAAILVLTVVACDGANAPEEEIPDTEVIAMEGEELLAVRCSVCHPVEVVTDQTLTRAEWEAVVEDMVARGAELTSEEQEVLVDYLAEVHGP